MNCCISCTFQSSVILSSRQRFLVQHRTGYETTLCITNLSKDILKDEATYVKYVQDLIAASKYLLIFRTYCVENSRVYMYLAVLF